MQVSSIQCKVKELTTPHYLLLSKTDWRSRSAIQNRINSLLTKRCDILFKDFMILCLQGKCVNSTFIQSSTYLFHLPEPILDLVLFPSLTSRFLSSHSFHTSRFLDFFPGILFHKRRSNSFAKPSTTFYSDFYISWAYFLDASSHLYMRSCPSVGPSVRPSVGRSVRPSLCNLFFLNAENELFSL